MRPDEVAERHLQDRIGHQFGDLGLLHRALTHATAKEHLPSDDNRRLAFLGDAVLELAVRCREHESSHASRGEMTERKVKLVRNDALPGPAKALGLLPLLDAGKGERGNSQGEETRLADAFEALAGAVFLDAMRQGRDIGHVLRVVETMLKARA